MSDQAFKDSPNTMDAPLPPSSRSNLPTRFGDKVVSFTLPRIDGEKPKGDERPVGEPGGPQTASSPSAASGPAPSRDWSSAIDLIHEASEAIRISQERSVELEAQLDQVMAQATSEVQKLNAQIAAGEQKQAQTEERLRATEARAAEAEGWLIRLHDAIFSAFTANQRAQSEDVQASRESQASKEESKDDSDSSID